MEVMSQMSGPGFDKCLFCCVEDNLVYGRKFVVNAINICCNSHDYDLMMKNCKLCLQCIGRIQQVAEFVEVLNNSRVRFQDSCNLCFQNFDEDKFLSNNFNDTIRNIIDKTILAKTIKVKRDFKCCFSCYSDLEMLNIITAKMKNLKEKYMKAIKSWTIPLDRIDNTCIEPIRVKKETEKMSGNESFAIENVAKLKEISEIVEQNISPKFSKSNSELIPKVTNKIARKRLNSSFMNYKHRSHSLDSLNCNTRKIKIVLTAASSRPKRISVSSNSTFQSEETVSNLSLSTNKESLYEEQRTIDLSPFNIQECSVALNKLNIQIDMGDDEENEENISDENSAEHLLSDSSRKENHLIEFAKQDLNTENICLQSSAKSIQQQTTEEDESTNYTEIEFLNNNKVIKFHSSGTIVEDVLKDFFDINSIEMNYTIEEIDSIEALEEIISTPTIQNTENIIPFDEFLKEDSLLVVN
ncbi:hypothetical protein PVAND_009955 [Polypedilum vanderplanki]|uniref:Uncharacterized protein n=1 Tax=Polypedilum vanderplanki TaxID=319348 RepID=A0A9J6CEU9_POLVA|nr:hypothetical protein PVAND_009955 [Polypedilum vanderplanki]